LASSLAATFVGRRAEHDRLQAAWKETAAIAERRVVLLSGEPGIGKTTLTARFAGEVHDEGATVVYGRCDEDLGIPYQPWIEALRALVAHAPQEVLAGHVADAGAHLARLVPELATRVEVSVPAGGDADAERFVLFGCVADLLERVTRDEPVLLVLDDLHWADRQSVQLLRHVVTCGRPMRLVVLGTFRDSDVTADDPIAELLPALHREQGVERVGLGGLGDDELLDLIEGIAGHEMSEEGLALRDAVLDETAGNPFFVGEILRHLADTGAIYQDDAGRWVGIADLRTTGMPVSVKEVVGRRVAGLGPDAERVLAFAAVIGRDFDVTLLAAVAGVDEDTVIDICDAGVAAAVLGVTDQPDRYTFSHALIEHTLYDGLSPARRLRAHQAVGEQLELLGELVLGDHVAQLAYHWSAALRPADATKAVHYSMLAGGRALEQLAPDEARRWYAQALELFDRDADPDLRRRAEILLGLGDAQRQCGIAEHRETLLEAGRLADDIDAVDLLVRAALLNTRMFQSTIGATDHDRIAVLERALERSPDTASADRARLLSLVAAERCYEIPLDERTALASEAVAAARHCGDPATLAFVLHVAANTAQGPPRTHAQTAAWAGEGCDLADGLGDIALRAAVHERSMMLAMDQGDLEAARFHFTTFSDLVDRVPHAVPRWQVAFSRVWITSLAGDQSEAERLAEAALEMGLESGQPDAMTVYAAQIASIRFHQGRLHELVPLIEQQAIDAPALVSYRAVLALACARGGDLSGAAHLLDEALATDFAMPEDLSWTVAMASWAEASFVVGHERAAAVLRDRIEPDHAAIVFTNGGVSPGLACALGRIDHLLGRYDEADAWFAEADALHRRLESPILIAHSDVAWAALLAERRRGDDGARARALASGALDVAERAGYGYVASDARQVLSRLG
jgi:tetratricopeptide (TPR) repeat protein